MKNFNKMKRVLGFPVKTKKSIFKKKKKVQIFGIKK